MAVAIGSIAPGPPFLSLPSSGSLLPSRRGPAVQAARCPRDSSYNRGCQPLRCCRAARSRKHERAPLAHSVAAHPQRHILCRFPCSFSGTPCDVRCERRTQSRPPRHWRMRRNLCGTIKAQSSSEIRAARVFPRHTSPFDPPRSHIISHTQTRPPPTATKGHRTRCRNIATTFPCSRKNTRHARDTPSHRTSSAGKTEHGYHALLRASRFRSPHRPLSVECFHHRRSKSRSNRAAAPPCPRVFAPSRCWWQHPGCISSSPPPHDVRRCRHHCGRAERAGDGVPQGDVPVLQEGGWICLSLVSRISEASIDCCRRGLLMRMLTLPVGGDTACCIVVLRLSRREALRSYLASGSHNQLLLFYRNLLLGFADRSFTDVYLH